MSQNRSPGAVIAWCLLIPCLAAHGHHSFAEYDLARTVEIEGKLVDVAWQNPHVHFKLQSGTQLWVVESQSLSMLRRTNATADSLKVGDTVKMAGWPSRRSAGRMFVTNVLPPDGRELVLDLRSKPRWGATAAGLQTSWLGKGVAPGGAATIFATWSSDLSDPGSVFPWKNPLQYPLTPRAKETLAKWDPLRDKVARDCVPMGMPTIIEQPYPVQFIDRDEVILMRMEAYDTVRTIHMKAAVEEGAKEPRTPLGYSVGHWEKGALIVETSRISWNFFDPSGVPQSEEVRIRERFTLNPEGSRLTDELTVTDPQTFTTPVILKRVWVRRPGEVVEPYRCVPEKAQG